MANLYWKEKKTDRDTTIRMLMDVLPDYTPGAFKVRQEGDDSGTYMCIYVERTEDKKEVCKEIRPITTRFIGFGTTIYRIAQQPALSQCRKAWLHLDSCTLLR